MLGEFLSRSVKVDGVDHRFAVYVPAVAATPPPAILFLHGYGESGTDGKVQAEVGLGSAIRSNPDAWPFLVVFPQKPEFEPLWPTFRPLLSAILAAVDSEFPTDEKRRYLTGLSQGGNGTLELGQSLDWNFAAMAPICGWANPRMAAECMEKVPTWIFHGEADPVVPVSSTTAILDWCARFETQPKVSTYPGVEHNSWDRAYAEPLGAWFLEHVLA